MTRLKPSLRIICCTLLIHYFMLKTTSSFPTFFYREKSRQHFCKTFWSKNLKNIEASLHFSHADYVNDDMKEFIMPPDDQLVSDTPIEQRGIGVGIDLGTTNSCAAILSKNGIPSIVRIPNNGQTMPSVVSFTNMSCLTGNNAVENEVHSPTSTFRNIKRIMGMGGTSAAISAEVVPNMLVKSAAMRRKGRSMSKKKSDSAAQPSISSQIADAEQSPALLSCQIASDSISKSSESSIKYYKPEEISSKVLITLFNTVENHIGTDEKITRAVVGVPAYFNDKQREATLRACELAGVKKARLLKEPEAAALAYGIGKKQAGKDNEDELILVFDLGGGTFDVSVLEVGNGIMEVLATSGNNMLGGSDFDARIAEFMSKLVGKEISKKTDGQGKNFWREGGEVKDILVRCAEAVRIYLSNHKVADISLPLTEDAWLQIENASDIIIHKELQNNIENINPSTHLIYKFTRKEMEDLCYDEFQALLRPVREVAILSQALLPGDARPNVVESALQMEEEMEEAMKNGGQLKFEDFFIENEVESTMNDENYEDVDPKILLQIQAQDLKSRKREQQGGRKRARKLAANEKKFREQKRKADEESKVIAMAKNHPSGKGGNVKVRDGIHGRPITQVVLVGGATRMPAIGRLLAAITGVVPQRTVNPDEAVALGCAVQVGILDGDSGLEGLQVLTPMQAALLRGMAEKRNMKVNT